MDNADQNIDDLSQKLKKCSNDLARLVACIDDTGMTKMSNNKSETPGINEKRLEMQLELVVNEKFKIEKKLAAVVVERDNFERELGELKSRYEKQETELQILRREVESMNQRKRDVFAKFDLIKNQVSVHDAKVGSLKRQFDEQIIDFLNGSASGNDASPVAGSTSDVTGQINNQAPKGMEPLCVESRSMKNISDRNNFQDFEPIFQRKTQVRLTRLPMARSSGTVIRRSESTSTTSQTKTVVEMKHPSNAVNKRKTSQAIVEGHRPKRTLRCTVCAKQYVSKPSQALCYCRYENQSD